MIKATDMEGKAFKVGDYFVSAQCSGSTAVLNKYQVLEILTKPHWSGKDYAALKARPVNTSGWRVGGKDVTINMLNRCYIVP